MSSFFNQGGSRTQFDGEISPEELFNMFFGGGMGGPGATFTFGPGGPSTYTCYQRHLFVLTKDIKVSLPRVLEDPEECSTMPEGRVETHKKHRHGHSFFNSYLSSFFSDSHSFQRYPACSVRHLCLIHGSRL